MLRTHCRSTALFQVLPTVSASFKRVLLVPSVVEDASVGRGPRRLVTTVPYTCKYLLIYLLTF